MDVVLVCLLLLLMVAILDFAGGTALKVVSKCQDFLDHIFAKTFSIALFRQPTGNDIAWWTSILPF